MSQEEPTDTDGGTDESAEPSSTDEPSDETEAGHDDGGDSAADADSTSDTHAVVYVGSARAYRHTMTGLAATHDAPRIEGLSPDERDDLLSTGVFERAESDDE